MTVLYKICLNDSPLQEYGWRVAEFCVRKTPVGSLKRLQVKTSPTPTDYSQHLLQF